MQGCGSDMMIGSDESTRQC